MFKSFFWVQLNIHTSKSIDEIVADLQILLSYLVHYAHIFQE